jgi:predicted DNA-binding transcriptional regulator
MTEKKATAKKVATKKATPASKPVAKKAEAVVMNAENVGFRAGDVYQVLAAAQKALSVNEIAQKAQISVEEAYLGIGWLFKEGKVKGEKNIVTLA